ncbi:MAG: hypothetical protein R3F13_15660 [Prosthecobacter sp.]
MKKFARLIFILFGLLLLLAVATPLAGAYILRRYMSREFLVLQTEKNINARVELKDVTLTLFTWPPSLRLSGIKIAPRDEFAGQPIEGRPALVDAPVNIDMAYAELVPEGLLKRQFLPRIIRFIGVDVRESINPRDGSSLEKLFAKPLEPLVATASDVPRAIPVEPAAPVTPPPAPPAPQVYREVTPPAVAQAPPPAAVIPEVEPAPAGSQAERLSLKEISIEQGRFHITNETSDARFDGEVSDFNLSITDIDIDPYDIANHNHLNVTMSSKIVLDGLAQIGGRMQEVRFADMKLHGEGDVNPVNPVTMQWSPTAILKLAIERDSVIGGHMTIGDAAGQELDKLLKYGVDLRNIRIGGPLMRELAVNLLVQDQSIKFLEDAHLALPEYEVRVKRESWINFAADTQGLLTRLYCGEALKAQIVNGVAARGLGSTVSRMVVDALSDDNGQLSFDLSVMGSLSHPQVKPDIQLRLESLLGGDIEDKAKGLIDTFKGLKGLFKK